MPDTIAFRPAARDLEEALSGALRRVPARSRRRFELHREGRRRRPGERPERLLFVSWAKDLSEERQHPIPRNGAPRPWEGHLVFVGPGTPAEALSEVARLRVRDPSRLLFVTVQDARDARGRLGAFVRRWLHAGDSEGILHAWWSAGSLHVVTTDFRRIAVPRSSVPALARADEDDCRLLEVSYDGSYVAWPSIDVHLGFERIEELVSPERALRRRQESDDFNRRYGAAIRAVRRARGLTQADVPGLSPRHVGRIERGESRATAKALRSVARALGLPEADYLAEVAAELESA